MEDDRDKRPGHSIGSNEKKERNWRSAKWFTYRFALLSRYPKQQRMKLVVVS